MRDADRHSSGATTVELNMIDRVIGRLAGEFTGFPVDVIAGVVRDEHAVFADRRVRDFVPVLVERVARRRLVCAQHGPAAVEKCGPGQCWDCPRG